MTGHVIDISSQRYSLTPNIIVFRYGRHSDLTPSQTLPVRAVAAVMVLSSWTRHLILTVPPSGRVLNGQW